MTPTAFNDLASDVQQQIEKQISRAFFGAGLALWPTRVRTADDIAAVVTAFSPDDCVCGGKVLFIEYDAPSNSTGVRVRYRLKVCPDHLDRAELTGPQVEVARTMFQDGMRTDKALATARMLALTHHH